MFDSVYSIIKALKTAKGTNNKIAIIKQVEDQDDKELSALLRYVVTFTYSSSMAYHITKLSVLNAIEEDNTDYNVDLYTICSLLSLLSDKGSADSVDKFNINRVYTLLSEEDRFVADLIIDRKLDCGCTIKTFRKVWGHDFCADFPLMKPQPYNPDKIRKYIKFPAWSEEKIDGERAVAIVTHVNNELNLTIKSSNGKKFKYLSKYLQDVFIHCTMDCVVDGEFIVMCADGSKPLNRRQGNGILNKSLCGTITEEEASRVRFIAWDMIPIEQYTVSAQVGETPFEERRRNLCNVHEQYISWKHRIRDLLPDYYDKIRINYMQVVCGKLVHNIDEAKEHSFTIQRNGGEGTILKNIDSGWENCRTHSQYKFKSEYPAELVVVGVELGKKGKWKGMTTGLVCESSCGGINTVIGMGLNDIQHTLNDDYWIAKIVSVVYNERSILKGRVVQKLSHARLDAVRLDKVEADSLEDIVAQEQAILYS